MTVTVIPQAAFALRALRTFFRWARHGLALWGALVLLFVFTFTQVRVQVDTTWAGLRQKSGNLVGVLVDRVSYRWRAPRRWEILVYETKQGEPAMKRVVALPGETIRMDREGRIFIDGTECPPPACLAGVQRLRFGNLAADKPLDCGTGYYVLGDLPHDLEDSRFDGLIPADKLIGRAWLVVEPRSRMGWVK